MHLDARLSGVPHGAVSEPLHREIRGELAVDPDEQIAVERRGHAQRIVVGQQQLAFGLDEVGAAAGSKWPMFDPRNRTSVRPDPEMARVASRRPSSYDSRWADARTPSSGA